MKMSFRISSQANVDGEEKITSTNYKQQLEWIPEHGMSAACVHFPGPHLV